MTVLISQTRLDATHLRKLGEACEQPRHIVKDRMAKRPTTQKTTTVTNFIQSYLHQFFDDSHGLKASLKPLRRPFNQYQSCLEAINNGRDIKQINW